MFLLTQALNFGTVAFDVRVRLYDDPPDKDAVKFVQATVDALALQGKLSRGWGSLFWKFFTTPTYRKFCEARDTSYAMSQKIVDNKVAELKKMAEEGRAFDDNQSECNFNLFIKFLSKTKYIKSCNQFEMADLRRPMMLVPFFMNYVIMMSLLLFKIRAIFV